MNVPITIRSVVFNSIKDFLKMVEFSIQFRHVAGEMAQVSLEMGDVMNMSCQPGDFLGVRNQMMVLSGMAIVSGLGRKEACFVLDANCKPVNVAVFIRVGLNGKNGNEQDREKKT